MTMLPARFLFWLRLGWMRLRRSLHDHAPVSFAVKTGDLLQMPPVFLPKSGLAPLWGQPRFVADFTVSEHRRLVLAG